MDTATKNEALLGYLARLRDLGAENLEMDFWEKAIDLLDETQKDLLLQNLADEEKALLGVRKGDVDSSPQN